MPEPQLGYGLPNHLPKKLSIGMFIWNWVTMATPGEPYHDLEKAVAGLPNRGFNAVRVEAGLNWCYQMDGQPRGEMEFGPWIAGYRDNLTSANDRGGGRHDVLKRVTRLMDLAKQHGIYVILTSWEYQDSSWLVADPKIRAEVMAVPEEKRLMHMARQHDRLLRALKDKGLHRNIAFVEVHNEPDAREAQRRKVQRCAMRAATSTPPLRSKFELRPPGTSMFELQVDLAINHGYWGMMPTTYCGAEHPIWDNVAWLRVINGRFQSGKSRA